MKTCPEILRHFFCQVLFPIKMISTYYILGNIFNSIFFQKKKKREREASFWSYINPMPKTRYLNLKNCSTSFHSQHFLFKKQRSIILNQELKGSRYNLHRGQFQYHHIRYNITVVCVLQERSSWNKDNIHLGKIRFILKVFSKRHQSK